MYLKRKVVILFLMWYTQMNKKISTGVVLHALWLIDTEFAVSRKDIGINMNDIKSRIKQLKEEKDAVILAHYYVDGDIQEIADYVGDSFYLSKVATKIDKKVIVFAGVSFMGESAKILNPDKTVIMPDINAKCPMAEMVAIDKIEKVRKEYSDVAVVCYINSTAKIKTYADVCVTSSNALKIVKALPNKNIFFIPDENLGRFVASQVPEKNFIFNDGFCPVHKKILKEDVLNAKKMYKDALVLTHPECTPDVCEISDYLGSTKEIIEYASKSDKDEFIICTETGVFYELEKQNPNKKFYPAKTEQICTDMKLITLEKIEETLKNFSNQLNVSKDTMDLAKNSLNKMLDLAK